MENTNLINLSKAIVAAQNDISAVAKDSTNSFHKFKYASSEDVIEEGRKALNAHGLALHAGSWEFHPNSSETESNQIGRVSVDYVLIHETGENMLWASSTPVVVDKGRPADKSEFAALTENLAYTLRGLLLIPRRNESDIAGRDDRNYQPKKATPKVEAPKEAELDLGLLASARTLIKAAATKADLDAIGLGFKDYPAGVRKALTPDFKQRMTEVS